MPDFTGVEPFEFRQQLEKLNVIPPLTSDGFLRVQNQTISIVQIDDSPISWMYLATTWSTEPVFNTSINGGDIYNYTLDGVTRYRFVPDPYNAVQDAFYGSFEAGVLSGKIAARGTEVI